MTGYHPDSKVEISGFMARHYDALLDLVTFGRYSKLISRVIDLMGIRWTSAPVRAGTPVS